MAGLCARKRPAGIFNSAGTVSSTRRQYLATLVWRYGKGIGVYKSGRRAAWIRGHDGWRLILYSCATTAILNENSINNIITNKVEGVSFFLIKTQFHRDLFCLAVALWNKYHFLHSTLFSLSVPLGSRARVFLLLLLERKRLWSRQRADKDVNFKCSEY